MNKPTSSEWFAAISIIANVILYFAIMLTQSDKKPYDDYRECTKYTNHQTCFEKTIGARP